jgi:Cu/Ag efflux pump CusA
MVRDIEKILSKNPDIDAYVRRTGAENGLFATQTSRGDIQVALRPAENDPVTLLTKQIRPTLEKLEKEILPGKKMKLDDPKTRDWIRATYRRRPMVGWTDRDGTKQPGVMDEVEDEVKDNFAEHQLKIELIQIMADELNDLSGASKPIEVKLFGPDQRELRRLASDIGDMLEKKGKGRGIKGANSNVFAGNPDLMVVVDPARAG